MLNHDLLRTLMTTEASAGDEDRLALFLLEWLADNARGVSCRRVGNTVVAMRGRPRVAVFAHIDSVGFTLDFDHTLIPIGGPDPEDGTPLRTTVGGTTWRGILRAAGGARRPRYRLEGEGPPGSAWIYDTEPALDEQTLRGAYLDNRVGVLTGLHLLERLEDVCVAFTAAEEISGRGALDAARWLYEETAIRQALIADITWATESVIAGKGPALSLRDAFIPRTAWFRRLRELAESSGTPFQIEIQSSGSSDGGMLERSGFGFDWLFVGAPEHGYHSAHEELQTQDAVGMLRLFEFLVNGLNA